MKKITNYSSFQYYNTIIIVVSLPDSTNTPRSTSIRPAKHFMSVTICLYLVPSSARYKLWHMPVFFMALTDAKKKVGLELNRNYPWESNNSHHFQKNRYHPIFILRAKLLHANIGRAISCDFEKKNLLLDKHLPTTYFKKKVWGMHQWCFTLWILFHCHACLLEYTTNMTFMVNSIYNNAYLHTYAVLNF